VDRAVRGGGGGRRAGGPAHFEEYNGDLDRFFEVSAFGVEGAGRFACVFSDITERKRAVESMRLNEARLESLLALSQRPTDSVQELLDFALAEDIRLTESRIGYGRRRS
jgi:hypothetical protein